MYNYYMNGMINHEDDINLLIANADYDKNRLRKFSFSYSFSDPRLLKLRNKYCLDQIAGNGSEFSRLYKITLWLANTLHYGNSDRIGSFHALDILEKTNSGFKSNCYIAATVLTECFLSIGIKARMIRCMPIDLRFNECHCMVIAFVKELKKYIAFDPAMGGCYFSTLGIPLSISELRSMMINGEQIVFRSIYPSEFTKNITQYLVKNMVRFQCRLISKYGNEAENPCETIINLNPTTIRLNDKTVKITDKILNYIFIYNDEEFWS